MSRRKKGGAHGGHGWFVTFADLMALLMSFFVMIAAYSTQDQKKLQLVAGSMRDAFGVTKESRYAGIIEQDGVPVRGTLKNIQNVSPELATDRTRPGPPERPDRTVPEDIVAARRKAFGQAAASLRQALQDLPEVAELSKNIIVEDTKEGLDLSLIDQDGRSMFGVGLTQPYDRTRITLERLAPTFRRLNQRIAITGYTASLRPGERPEGPPWELSAGRATSVREILAGSGVPDSSFASVAGKADTSPMFPDNPYLAANRRVTITLLNEPPPSPPDLKP